MSDNTNETSCSTQEIQEETRKRNIIEELEPTQEDLAKKSVATVFRTEAAKMTADLIALSEHKINLIKTLYGNVEKLNDKIFSGQNYKTLTTKEALFALSVQLKAIATLTPDLNEHNENVKNINIQINQILQNENDFKDMPIEKRRRIREAVEYIASKVIKAKSDTDILNESVDEATKEKLK